MNRADRGTSSVCTVSLTTTCLKAEVAMMLIRMLAQDT